MGVWLAHLRWVSRAPDLSPPGLCLTVRFTHVNLLPQPPLFKGRPRPEFVRKSFLQKISFLHHIFGNKKIVKQKVFWFYFFDKTEISKPITAAIPFAMTQYDLSYDSVWFILRLSMIHLMTQYDSFYDSVWFILWLSMNHDMTQYIAYWSYFHVVQKWGTS